VVIGFLFEGGEIRGGEYGWKESERLKANRRHLKEGEIFCGEFGILNLNWGRKYYVE